MISLVIVVTIVDRCSPGGPGIHLITLRCCYTTITGAIVLVIYPASLPI